jgi:hypothetical protein
MRPWESAAHVPGGAAAAGRTAWPCLIRRTRTIEIRCSISSIGLHFASDEARKELLDQLRNLPGVAMGTQKLTGSAAFSVSELLRDDLWGQFVTLAAGILGKSPSRYALRFVVVRAPLGPSAGTRARHGEERSA